MRMTLGPALVSQAESLDDSTSEATVWERWEHTLTSTCSYSSPYADVILQVLYTGPGGRTVKGYGFWDGGDTFCIRCVFLTPGTWRWETKCSDTANAGLYGQRGTVEVVPYRGDNPLYRHGFLKVSGNQRYLTYAMGHRFCGWVIRPGPGRCEPVPRSGTPICRSRRQTLYPYPGGARVDVAGSTDRNGEIAFTDKSCSAWNPAYWQSFEQKIEHANEAGLAVLLVGLMEPVQRYPQAEQACLFARNIIARLFGNFVIFSPRDSMLQTQICILGLVLVMTADVHFQCIVLGDSYVAHERDMSDIAGNSPIVCQECLGGLRKSCRRAA